jgi:hypothetical protein
MSAAAPLQVSVVDAFQNGIGPGVSVTFAAPGSGASGTFPGGNATVTVATDANSQATAPAFTANGTAGSYEVTASVAGVSTPAVFDLLNVSRDAVIDGPPGGAQSWLSSAGAPGSVSYLQNPNNGGWGSTLTGLTSFTLNGPGILIVTLPSAGPLLPGPLRFNPTPGAGSVLQSNASRSTGPGTGFVTQPGSITVGGQAVLYSNTPALALRDATGVNAAVLPYTAEGDSAFRIGPPDYTGRPTLLQGNDRFVQALYLDVLGRPGTLSDIEAWASLVSVPGVTRATVAADIERSFEARDHLVKTWYMTYLGRQVQGGEELAGVHLLQAGWTEEEVLSVILGSAEFFERAQALMSSGTPTQRYVQALGQVLLGRSASGAELAGWDAGLAALGTRGLALAFLQSREFRTDQFEGYYNVLLHRPDDKTGLDACVNSSLDMFTARISVEGSPEFYANG